jgi:hypothetical protein
MKIMLCFYGIFRMQPFAWQLVFIKVTSPVKLMEHFAKIRQTS